MHELISDQAVTVWCSRVDGQQEGQLVLVDLIHTEDAGELADDQRLLVGGKVKGLAVHPTPAPNAAFTGTYPEVVGQTSGHVTHSHPVSVNGLHRFVDDTVGIDGPALQERWLGAEKVTASGTVMYADGNV